MIPCISLHLTAGSCLQKTPRLPRYLISLDDPPQSWPLQKPNNWAQLPPVLLWSCIQSCMQLPLRRTLQNSRERRGRKLWDKKHWENLTLTKSEDSDSPKWLYACWQQNALHCTKKLKDKQVVTSNCFLFQQNKLHKKYPMAYSLNKNNYIYIYIFRLMCCLNVYFNTFKYTNSHHLHRKLCAGSAFRLGVTEKEVTWSDELSLCTNVHHITAHEWHTNALKHNKINKPLKRKRDHGELLEQNCPHCRAQHNKPQKEKCHDTVASCEERFPPATSVRPHMATLNG